MKAGGFPAFFLFVPECYPSPAKVVGAYLDPHPVVHGDLDVVPCHLPARPGQYLEVVVQPHQEEPVPPGLDGGAVNLNEKLRLNFSYFTTLYSDYTVNSANYLGTGVAGSDTYSRTNNVFGVGIDYKF